MVSTIIYIHFGDTGDGAQDRFPGFKHKGHVMINKNFLNLVMAGAVMATAILGTSSAAQAASADATARATILQPVAITNNAALDFGTIVPNGTSATVSVSTAGTRNCGTLVCVGSAAAASFGIAGTTGQTVGITVAPTVTLSDGNGNNMVATLTGSATTLSLVSGANAVTVGGALAVSGSQLAGNYSGTFTVAVEYQ